MKVVINAKNTIISVFLELVSAKIKEATK